MVVYKLIYNTLETVKESYYLELKDRGGNGVNGGQQRPHLLGGKKNLLTQRMESRAWS